MDAREDLLLSEGVCRELGVGTTHPEVGPVIKGAVRSQVLEPGQSAGKTTDTVTATVTDTTTDNDTVTDPVTVKLVKTVCVLPSQSVVAQVQLSSTLLPPGPVLIEADPMASMTNLRGIQLSDVLVTPDNRGLTTKSTTSSSDTFCCAPGGGSTTP